MGRDLRNASFVRVAQDRVAGEPRVIVAMHLGLGEQHGGCQAAEARVEPYFFRLHQLSTSCAAGHSALGPRPFPPDREGP